MPIRPRTPFESIAIPVGGGLNLTDAPESLAPGEATVLENLRIYGLGRITTRRGHSSISPIASGSIVGIFPYAHGTDANAGASDTGCAYLVYDSGTSTVNLYAADANGLNATSIGSVWSSVSARPKVTGAILNRKLFLVDEDKDFGLVVYDGIASSIYQPTFQFESGTHATLNARCVTAYNNMLFVAGYGSETDSDRPEVVRFSFLGLDGSAGNQDGGDAGDGGAANSTNLFDVNDYFMVGERGTPVVAMKPGAGRLVIATERATYVLFGYDRNSFQLDLVDGQVGCVATRSMVAANGVVYWWSQEGPARFGSGGVDTEFGRKLGPRISEVDTEKVFAYHAPHADEVRFMYVRKEDDPSANDPNRALCWNYRHNAWREELIGSGSFFCAGSAREGSGAFGGPAGAPSAVSHESITTSSMVATWTPYSGIQSDATTIVQLYVGTTVATGTFSKEVELPSDSASHEWTGLTANTAYTTNVFHKRNGSESTHAENTATTLALGTLAPPSNLEAEDDPIEEEGYGTITSVLLSWQNGSANVYTTVHRSTTTGFTPSSSNQIYETSVDATSMRDSNVVGGTTYYYLVVNHSDSLAAESDPSNEASVTPTAGSTTPE